MSTALPLPAADAAPSPRRQVLTAFSGILLAMFLAALDQTVVGTALPTIVGELGGLDKLSWVVTSYLLAQTVITPIYGKLGDLYGRKRMLQSAVVLFLAGSVLCGLSRNMFELIAFRAIQGCGGGGLMVTAMAAIADLVPPRERGRYQGLFGAVFGLSSAAGPLIGGWLTTHWSWRWIFYINLPLGIVALALVGATLPSVSRRVRHRIDIPGAVLLTVALTSIVLATDMAGGASGFEDSRVLGLAALALMAIVALAFIERRAAEPVLPMHLFRNRAFVVTCAIGLIAGFAMFGSVTYLPVFLQAARGQSPTAAGLQMLPMIGGMLLSSIASGQVISRTGRYKVFPIAGTALMTVALFVLSRTLSSPLPVILTAAFVLGAGMGLVMQVLVLAVQNSVAYRDLGVATSGNSLFRSVGGAVGTALLGVIFVAGFGHDATSLHGAALAGGSQGINLHTIASLPAPERAQFTQLITDSMETVFLTAAAAALAGFALSWALPERPLRETLAAASADWGKDAGEAVAMPESPEPDEELVRGLAAVMDRDLKREHIARIVARAGFDIRPAAAWLLARLCEDPQASARTLQAASPFEPRELALAASELVTAGWLQPRPEGPAGWKVSESGCEAAGRLVAARRAHLADLFAEWSGQEREELRSLLARLRLELVPEPRT
ncbi:MAG TPA: MDR family MFS transporter [Ramlibacter sp.]|nr:MDR family MFS transporter [Ramlibacter sp.]HVZ44767.1 MDR family MFS transporter [Ramlibacter sp.]